MAHDSERGRGDFPGSVEEDVGSISSDDTEGGDSFELNDDVSGSEWRGEAIGDGLGNREVDPPADKSVAGPVSGPLDIVSGRKPIVGAEDVAVALGGTEEMDHAEEKVSEKHGEPVQL